MTSLKKHSPAAKNEICCFTQNHLHKYINLQRNLMGELYSKNRTHTTTSTCDFKIMFTHNTFIQKYE